MAWNSSKTLPSLSKGKTYEDCLKLIKVWRCFTDLSANRQSSAVLSLEDEAPDTVLEIDDEDIAKEDGVDAIIEHWNRLFKKDSAITKNQALEAFETFRRPASMSIQAFLNECDKRLYKMKSYGAVQSDDILAYCLLKSVNLFNNHEELIKATVWGLKYDLTKDQLQKTFSDASRHIPTKNEKVIKAEDTFLTEEFSQMAIQEWFNAEQEYNPFRSTNSQQTWSEIGFLLQ